VIALFEKDRMAFDSDLLFNAKRQLETLVRMGESIGKKP